MNIYPGARIQLPDENRRRRLFAWLAVAWCLGLASAPAQDVRGYRGQWNDWGYESMSLGRSAWRVTIQANGASNKFKIATTNWSPDPGAYEWTHGGTVALATVLTAYTGGGSSLIGGTVLGRHYTFAMDDVAYGVPGQLIVQETENEPIAITSVAHAAGESNAVVRIGTAAAPSPGEKIVVRFSFDGGASSSFAEAIGSGTNWSVQIVHTPAEAGQTCVYYVLSTTVAAPSHAAADLQTLRWNDNGGSGYSYVVPGEPPPAPIHINEVLSSNDSGAQDEDGDYSDWVELYNAGATPIALAGWGLSDNSASPFKWTFGDVTIPADGFLVVWASSKNRPAVTNGNQIHTSFAISAGGEEVVLTHPDGTRVDEFAPIAIPTDFSRGRQPDATGPWKFFPAPTPGAANLGAGYESILAPPAFSIPGGIFTSNVTLDLSTTETGAVIRYTTDGSEPTASSALYTNALRLGSKAGTPNDLSEIPSNYLPTGPDYYEGWEPPAGEVFKFHTVRARVFKAGAMPSSAPAQSYLVDAAGTNRFHLPIVSLATDEDNFFDPDIGIYVPGNHNNYLQSGSAWERPGTIEFFEPGGALAFSGNIGIRLHGNTTRTRPRKALRIYARGPSTFNYQLFPDKPLATFSTFILRNGGNDWGNGVIRDFFHQSLVANTALDRQYGRPVLVFLNGEYWGLHDLRERFDDGYAEHNYGLDEMEYVQMEIDRTSPLGSIPVYDSGNPAGTQSYYDLRGFMQSNNLAIPANYAQVQDQLDTDNFIDFFQAHIFFGNTDWPGNNIRLWRSMATNRTADAPYRHDGRWRHMLYDTDFGFGLKFNYVPGSEIYQYPNWFGVFAQHDTLAFAASTSETDFSNHPDATMMFRRLLANADFRRDFVVRFSDQLNTAYGRAHVTNRWAQCLALVEPEMAEHVHRWRQPYDWASEKSRIRSYGEQRTANVWNHVRDYFNLAAPVSLTIQVTNAAAGFVRINQLDLDPGTAGFNSYPWTGAYFTNYPVTLAAQSRLGFQFVEWRKNGFAFDTNATIEAGFTGAVQYEAVFEADPPPAVVAPIGFQQLVEGPAATAFDLNAIFADPEGDPLSFAATADDTNRISAVVAGSTLTVTPRLRGEANVTVTATDGNTPVTNAFRVLVYPAAHVLENGPFVFGEWDATLPDQTYPAHLIFLQSDQSDTALDTPLLHSYRIPLDDASTPADAQFPYAAAARTRINGLGTNGIAFINTGRNRDLGGALLALDTRNVSNAPVEWLGGTVLPNVRIYAIRLQYRLGVTNDFADLLDGDGQPVEYLRSGTAGHSQARGPVRLPEAALGQEYVQLLWRYYRISGTNGARAQLRLDDIRVDNRLDGFTAWQFAAFSAAELADPAISGPAADPDEPGVANLLRYGLGIGRADLYGDYCPVGAANESGTFYRHRRLLALDPGVAYAIHATRDLVGGIWDPIVIGEDLIESGTTPTGDGLTETIEYQLPPGTLATPRHFRLHIVPVE